MKKIVSQMPVKELPAVIAIEAKDGKRKLGFNVRNALAAIAVAAYVIIDLEYPRLGLIRVDEFDHDLDELQSSIS